MSFRSSFNFLRKTIQGIKSFVSGGCGCGNYQKLPKHSLTPLHSLPPLESKDSESAPTSHSDVRTSRGERNHPKAAKRAVSRVTNGDGSGTVRKLRELELLDSGNIEHVLDVEEVIHYYSLLKCPVYRGIVDEFFADIYVEFHGDSAAAANEDTSGR